VILTITCCKSEGKNVCNREMQKFYVERFNLKKLNNVEVRGQDQIKIFNSLWSCRKGLFLYWILNRWKICFHLMLIPTFYAVFNFTLIVYIRFTNFYQHHNYKNDHDYDE